MAPNLGHGLGGRVACDQADDELGDEEWRSDCLLLGESSSFGVDVDVETPWLHSLDISERHIKTN